MKLKTNMRAFGLGKKTSRGSAVFVYIENMLKI
jgi:hypothetical protein